MAVTRPITDLASAKEELTSMCAAGSPPLLTDPDLERILAKNLRGARWTAATAYRLGDRVVPSEGQEVGLQFRCVAPGISSDTEPAWTLAASAASNNSTGFYLGDLGSGSFSLGDGTTAWVAEGLEEDLWDMEEAARQGWEEKASRVAGLPNTSIGGVSHNFSDVYRQCMERAAAFGGQFIK